MEWCDILYIYSLVSILLFIFSVTPLSKDDYESFSWKAIFVFQYELYKHMKDKLNMLGIVILETIITILTFGSSIIMFIIILITCTFMLSLELFCFVFKIVCNVGSITIAIPFHIRAICFSANGDILGSNIYKQDIAEILSDLSKNFLGDFFMSKTKSHTPFYPTLRAFDSFPTFLPPHV